MVTARLFLVLLFVAAMLLGILLFNNIFLYKQKVTQHISLMLIYGVIMCFLEIVWTLTEWNPELAALAYIAAGGYGIALVIFADYLNLYLLDRLGIKPSKKWLIVCYILPAAAIALLYITAPWTKFVFWVDKRGIVQVMPVFDIVFHSVVYFYFFSPLFAALYFMTTGKDKRPADCEISASMFIFGVMIPVFYWIELIILGNGADDYGSATIPVSLALVYLVTNTSTRAVLETQAQVEAVETDLRIASKIQMDALPPEVPEFAEPLGLDIRGSMTTAKEVGGDFYDYFPLDDYRICFLIADVSGKGTPAALFMMTAKTMIKDYALTRESTSEIFNIVNSRLCENNDEGMFATAWIGILDTRTMLLQYTNAGHNYPVFQPKGQPCEELNTVHGLFLAGMEYTRYKQSELQLTAGDRLLLYTDGITEAHNIKSELYGTDRLLEVLGNSENISTKQTLDSILDDVNDFSQYVPQFDDMTMVILSVKEGGK